jgi:hypothetical protein
MHSFGGEAQPTTVQQVSDFMVSLVALPSPLLGALCSQQPSCPRPKRRSGWTKRRLSNDTHGLELDLPEVSWTLRPSGLSPNSNLPLGSARWRQRA